MSELPRYAEALERMLAAAEDGPPVRERCDATAESAGRTLAAPIVADRDLPPFDRSAMDGYAIRTADLSTPGGDADAVHLPVHADVAAGAPAPGAGPPGTCVRIATGAPVPAGLDAVVPHERTDRGDPVRIPRDAARPGDAVHPRGADARRGDVLAGIGTRVNAAVLGLAATVGTTRICVAARPRIAILTTGDEVLAPNTSDLRTHQIRNGNAPLLRALCIAAGANVVRLDHAEDSARGTVNALAAAAAAADIVLTVGGISAGDHDHVAGAIEALDGRTVLRGAAIQPGRPITAAMLPDGGPDEDRTPAFVIALPGNPVSSLACATLFVAPVIARRLGASPAVWRPIPLAAEVQPNPRRQAFRPALITADGAVVPQWQGSGDLAHTAATAGLVELPVQADPLPVGTLVPFLPWPGALA